MRKLMLVAVVIACLSALAAPCFAAADTSAPSSAAVGTTSSVGQPEQLTEQEMEATTGEWVTIYRGNWVACQYQLFSNAGKYNGMWIQRVSFWIYELRGNPRWSL